MSATETVSTNRETTPVPFSSLDPFSSLSQPLRQELLEVTAPNRRR